MSETQRPDGPVYSPHDWWGDEQTDAETPHADIEAPGTTRAEWVAFDILQSSAQLLCGKTLSEISRWARDDVADEPTDSLVQLSEPRAFPPYDKLGKNSHARRVNEDTGYMNWGEDTWVQLADRPTGRFMAVVDAVLEDLPTTELPPGTKRDIRERAERMKRHEDGLRDTDVMAHVVRWIDHPSLLDN